MCEAVAIYGVIMAIILQGKMNEAADTPADFNKFAYCGYALFWTGITVGFSNLACGYRKCNLEFVLESQAVDVLLLMLSIQIVLSKF